MARCEDYLELLSAKLDEELTAEEEVRLAAHLEQCPQCRALLEELSRLSGALRTLPEAEPPADLTEQVMKVLQAEGATPSASGAPQRARRPHRKAIRAVAAMAAVAVISTVAAFHLPWNPTSIPSETDGLPSAAVEYSAHNDEAVDTGDITPYSAAEHPTGEPRLTTGSEPPTAKLGGYGFSTASAIPETTPPSTVRSNGTEKGAGFPAGQNVTALLYCYGLASMPALPDYLSEQLYCEDTDCYFPADRLPALRNILETAEATTELEQGEAYTGASGEWVQIIFLP